MSVVQPHTLVRDLSLCVRVLNALDKAGIANVEQLITYSAMELLRVPTFGRVSLAQVVAELESHGFKLRDDGRSVQSNPVEHLRKELALVRHDIFELRQFIGQLLARLSDQGKSTERMIAEIREELRRRSPYELQAWRGLEYRVQQLERSGAGERLRQ